MQIEKDNYCCKKCGLFEKLDKKEDVKQMLEIIEEKNENTCYYNNCNKKPKFLVSFRKFNDPIMCTSIPGGTFKMCSEHEEKSRKCKNYIKSIKIKGGD